MNVVSFDSESYTESELSVTIFNNFEKKYVKDNFSVEESWVNLPSSSTFEINKGLEKVPSAASRQALRNPIDICETDSPLPAKGDRAVNIIDPVFYPLDSMNMSSGFGYRVHPTLMYVKYHNGVDYKIPAYSPIYSVYDGVVEEVSYNGVSGNYVVIKHNFNGEIFYTEYLHQVTPSFRSVGEVVRAGDVIGSVGSTGRSTGPHLHFGVKDKNKNYIDPFSWLQAKDPIFIQDNPC